MDHVKVNAMIRARRLTPVIGFAFLVFAIWLLKQELRTFSVAEIESYLRSLPPWRILAAIALTSVNYLVLTGYDALAIRYVDERLPYRKTALASFVAYAFSIALGHAVLTGGAIRYRLYSYWRISGEKIAKIVAFCGLAFWVGYLSLGGLVFSLSPPVTPPGFRISPRLLGIAFIGLFVAWLLVNASRRKHIRILRWTVDTPGVRSTIAQAFVASLDLTVAATVLWVLLPPETPLSFGHLLAAYLLAVIAGVVSMVPGGLGVFDGLLVALLSPTVPATVAVGALVAYRGIYYLLPLLAATSTFVGTELVRSHTIQKRAGAVTDALRVWLPTLIPRSLAALTFVAGALLLVTGSLPSSPGQIDAVARLVPVPAIELSHFLGSVAGAALLVVARGLGLRRDGAYWIAIVLLGIGILSGAMRGLGMAEAVLLGITLAFLLPCRRFFRRRSALLAGPRTPGWAPAIVVVLTAAVAIGFFAYREVEYTGELWWRFAVDADAPRFLRGAAGASVVLLLAGLVRLLRSRPRSVGELPTEEAIVRAKRIIASSADTESNLVLLRDKRILFPDQSETKQGDGFLMYAPKGASWIAMGAPIGDPIARDDLAWSFRTAADEAGARIVFYEVSESDLPLMLDLGLVPYKLGEEASVRLSDFTLDGGKRKNLRRILRKLDDAGCTVEIIPVDDAKAVLPELKRVSDAWLGEKSVAEKGFSLGVFDERYLTNFSIAVVRMKLGEESRIVAFANLWLNNRHEGTTASAIAKTEMSIDLMRFDRERAPEGVMDYLFTKLMLWGASEGYGAFSLGMAPLSGLDTENETRALSPLWNRVGAALYRHGEHFYNFQGLRGYKNKFDPDWSSRYLAVPRGNVALAGALVDVTSLIAGGLAGIVRK